MSWAASRRRWRRSRRCGSGAGGPGGRIRISFARWRWRYRGGAGRERHLIAGRGPERARVARREAAVIWRDILAAGGLAALAGALAVPAGRRLVLGDIRRDWLMDQLDLDRIEGTK